MAVSKRLRFEVLRRDNHTCRYCGMTAPDVVLQVDHVTPVALGGTDDPSNLVTACRDCNAGKSSANADASVVGDVSGDAIRWAAAMKQAASIQAKRGAERQQYVSHFDDHLWSDWSCGPSKEPIPRPADWSVSVERWFDHGVDMALLADCVRIAMEATKIPPSRTWKYFCGCVWRRLEEQAAIAGQILQGGDF